MIILGTEFQEDDLLLIIEKFQKISGTTKDLNYFYVGVDYDPRTEVSMIFFKTVQNKMHWAAHGQTAAKKIYYSANAEKPYMGMLMWKRILSKHWKIWK